MDEVESSDFMSSCDSLYSVDSASSGEDDSCEDLDAFLSDSVEDEVALRGGRCERRRLSPDSGLDSARSPSLLRVERECRTLRPAGQTLGRHQPRSYSIRHPGLLENGAIPSACARLAAEEARLPARNLSPKKPEGGLKRLAQSLGGERECPGCSLNPAALGVKRQRTKEDVEEKARWRESRGEGDEGKARSEGDRIFAQKCRELQGFIKPLLGLLNGLKRGRYERGLSSFQQSVAMDRIQRIVGVLQKPEMGERYLGTLLQVEMMLKVWFPRVALCSSSPPEYGTEDLQDRPAKNVCTRCTEMRSLPGQPVKHPSARGRGLRRESPGMAHEMEAASGAKDSARLLPGWSAVNLTWMHTSPICNPPLRPVADVGTAPRSPGTGRCGVVLLPHSNLTSPACIRSASVPLGKSSAAACPRGARPTERGALSRSRSVPGAGVSLDGSRIPGAEGEPPHVTTLPPSVG
ncbi:circadian-associated transcriptional repressor [Rhinatrema bivittatum]|uniref:circadian-associated transcriptional repressor n=1 Tax=Rhinatrema bivittatum TaxID=194408 RepID=UPI00112795A6|nr:circadian-associated transcriptional repressor [Rhinatrema bivittatum]XP_029437653.1 circadian-associated transcriptional repressor [Rhinatrema bivittatum]XP_029437654.1 circadian-associated transcriptional repressor [Rhinatrema bivittatum]